MVNLYRKKSNRILTPFFLKTQPHKCTLNITLNIIEIVVNIALTFIENATQEEKLNFLAMIVMIWLI